MAINVTMTSKDGVTLATNGKYCEDNIKVSLSDTDSANLVASNIKKEVTILGVKGTAQIVTGGAINITNNGTHNVAGYSSANVNVPIPDGYIKPSGNIAISTSSPTDVKKYATATISDANLKAEYIKDGVTILGYAGTFTNDGTATASDILSGKTAYVKGSKIEGTIATRTESNISVSGNSVFVQPGYYAQSAQKTVGTAKGATTYTPGTTNQTIASGTYLTGTQTIKGDSNLIAANIKKGVSIFGVSGNHAGWGLDSGNIYLSDAESVDIELQQYGDFYCDSWHDLDYCRLYIEWETDSGEIQNYTINGANFYLLGARIIVSGNMICLFSGSGSNITNLIFDENVNYLNFVFYGDAYTSELTLRYNVL